MSPERSEKDVTLMGESVSAGSDNFPLGEAARSVWAKSDHRSGEWLPLVQHMIDTGRVAESLFDRWLAPGLRRLWAQPFGGDESRARAVFVFLASCHDVGKGAPVFVAQVEGLAQRCRVRGLPCPQMDSLRQDRKELPHATVSALALESWLMQAGVDEVLCEQLSSIVGAHHGRPVVEPPGRQWRRLRARPRAMGGDDWEEVRHELLDLMENYFPCQQVLLDNQPEPLPLPVQVSMCGLIVMADWLASNQEFFPLRPLDGDLSPELISPDELSERIERALGDAALPCSWSPRETDGSVDELFKQRFGWADDWKVRPLQRAAVELARDEPVGLMIIEAQMGAGKTEAAYAAAEQLAIRWGAHGLFIALPTQATTDAMFSRLMDWVGNLPEEPAEVPAYAMTLAHGKALLNPRYATQVEAFRQAWLDDEWLGGPENIHDEEPEEVGGDAGGLTSAVAHQWFNGRKRRLLTNFGAGTIDQILMAALQQKHLMVRHLALAGKVIVIDEVHASDTFMNVYLDRVLGWLGHYGTPVVLLSATLTQERKQAMIEAYAPGLGSVPVADGYPCLTWVDSDRLHAYAMTVHDDSRPREVSWSWLEDDDERIIATLREELRDGGCALVVRNTVKDAQRLADRCRESGVAPEVTLVHSRFLSADRARNDLTLLEHFGKSSGLGSRPEKAVVIATQVVEQSLDVDFDVLITDLAPIDLVLQRIGRLHRHDWRTRPPRLSAARTYIVASRDDGPLPLASRGSQFVYGQHHLLRTAFVLEQHGNVLHLPEDIAPLVQKALGNCALDADEAAAVLLEQAAAKFRDDEKKRLNSAKTWALRPFDPVGSRESNLSAHGWLDMSSDFSELAQQATVRDSEPSLEVVVAVVDPDGNTAMVPPWMDDPQAIDVSSVPDDQTARRIASWTVKLPHVYGSELADVEQAVLTQTRCWSWKKHPLLKKQPILVMRQIEEGSHTVQGTIRVAPGREIVLRYDPTRGLEEVNDDVQSH